MEAAGRQGPLPQYRRPDHLRVPDAAAPGRGGRARDARRAQRLRAVGRHRAGARSGRRRVHAPRHAARPPIAWSSPSGTSEGIELALTALAGAGRRGADPGADLSALHRRAREDRRAGGVLPHRPGAAAGCRTSIRSGSLITPATRALVVDRSEQSDRRRSTRPTCAARWSSSPTSTTSRCSPTRSTPTSRSTARSTPIASAQSGCAGHHLLVAVEGLPRAGLARRLDGGRPHRAPRRRARRRSRSWRTDGCAAPAPMEYAIVAALNGDRIAPAAVPRRAARAGRR